MGELPIFEINRLRALQAEDMANCLKWWRESRGDDRMRVWDRIQQAGKTPLEEVVLRFAQLGMTEAAIRDYEIKRQIKGDGNG